MRIFTVSDLHIEYRENAEWLFHLSQSDFRNDFLILAGDLSNKTDSLGKAFTFLKKCFKEVLFVPGNHDLWIQNGFQGHSLDKFRWIMQQARDCGIRTKPWHSASLSIIPLFGWYDYSFGEPSSDLRNVWMDYVACQWPAACDPQTITHTFLELNKENLEHPGGSLVISFSHFLPRIDLMPPYIPAHKQNLYPVLGTALLQQQIRQLGSGIHIYGHSHVNRHVVMDHITYINNAFGYPHEERITAKKLFCVREMQP